MNGFYRVAACSPELRPGDPAFNAARIREAYAAAADAGAAAVVFPELSVTGYTCGDFFENRALLAAAERAAAGLVRATEGRRCLLVFGLPVRVGPRLFNAAAVAGGGRLFGLPMKEHLPNYREFYEKRQFRPAHELAEGAVRFLGADVPAGGGLVFACGEGAGAFRFGVEICEDLWSVRPPSGDLALGGAHAVFNLSAGDELVAKADYRRSLVAGQSARLCGVYLLAGAGVGESTSESVFSGHSIVAFNGRVLAETERFARGSRTVAADVNPAWCDAVRASWSSFCDAAPERPVRLVALPALPPSPDLALAGLDPRPFVPAGGAERAARCAEILSIQASGLAARWERTASRRLVVGLSGGLDSTLALLVCARAADLLSRPRGDVLAVTMPGFGTTARTKGNAEALASELGAELRTVPIGPAVERHFEDIGHDPAERDVTYENAQARERTQILMDLANQERGLVVGTGDLSEIALGWSTYNGDQMSMYGVNCGVPKTLVRHVVSFAADEAEAAGSASLAAVLRDVVATPVSPELLPGGAEGQKTEGILGRYELHDFFLYHFLKWGETRENLRAFALRAFGSGTSGDEVDRALDTFLKRFVSQQFKRDASPSGPKVGTLSLSPRGDWRAPADMSGAAFS